MTGHRRRARRAALQVLFEVNQTSHDPHLTLGRHASGLSSEGHDFAQSLVAGVVDNREQIDRIIEEVAPAWPINQMAVTDRIALEIGIYEVCIRQDAPFEAAINEAVELAKTFGGENSAGFVNGVMRTVAERMPVGSHK